MHVELLALCLGQELCYELVVCKFKFFMHAGHYANVIIINQIDFFEIQHFRKLPCLVGKEEICDRLRLKWESRSEFQSIFLQVIVFLRSLNSSIIFVQSLWGQVELLEAESEVKKNRLNL